MNTLPSWDTSGLRWVDTRVYVNGTVTGHESVTWGQSLLSTLPRQVEAADGFGQRTGSIVWWRPGISRYLASPWSTKGGELPKPGDRVEVNAVDGKGNEVRVFTGIIDSVEGDGSGQVTSRIVDRIDDFNRTVRVQAITEIGIPWADGRVRRLAPTNAWTIDEIGRQLGYFATPPAPSGTILDAPLQGTTYVYAEPPNHANAQLLTSHAQSGGTEADNSPPRWRDGGSGLALHDAYLEYIPYSGGGSGFRQLRVSMVVHPDHASDASVSVRKTSLFWVGLHVDAYRRVTVSATSGSGAANNHRAFRLPMSDGPVVVSAIFRDNRVSVKDSTGQEVEHPLNTPLQPVDLMVVNAESGSAISGAQVSDPGPSGGHVAADWTPSMVNGYGAHCFTQVVTPSIRDRNAKEVLSEFSEKMLCPVWLDGNGVLQVQSSETLMAQPPALTVYTATRVSDLGWGSAVTDMRAPVHVKWSEVKTDMNYNGAAHSINLHEGSTSQAGDSSFTHLNHTIEIPDNEEWPNFGGTPGKIDQAYKGIQVGAPTAEQLAAVARFNAGEGSWIGAATDIDVPKRNEDGTYAYDSNNEVIYEQEERFNGSVVGAVNVYNFTVVTPWKFSLEMGLARGNVTKVAAVEGIRKRWHGMSLPILRGPGRVERTEATLSYNTTRKGLASLTHDMGAWCTSRTTANNLGEWLSKQLLTNKAKVHRLTVRFDPRLDVGMAVRISSRDIHGAVTTGLVVSVDQNPSAGETVLEVRTTSSSTVESNTYADLASAWGGADYADLAGWWEIGTYSNLATEPTRSPQT